ncbi:MAG: methyltransferase domain-containing protein [Methylococcales bacterium]
MIALEEVREYYGKVLTSKQDLQTTACCPIDVMPEYLKSIATMIHPEITNRFYGCGVPLPSALQGRTVLDLGCGTGRDAYILSKLVGEKGQIIGVDMTQEQLSVAINHIDYHMQKFGFNKSNINFLHGYIEDLKSLNIKDNSVDVVVSNCVFNLSPQKNDVFSEIFRALKPGGELYFSDVFSDRRLSTEIQSDPVLRGECLGGAMYTEDFRRLLLQLGCADARPVSNAPIEVTNPKLATKLGNAKFSSITWRAFKLDLEDRCENYGQTICYQGTLENHPHSFKLDDHHLFDTGQWSSICANTASMLMNTRFAPHFKLIGDTSKHYGLFDCSSGITVSSNDETNNCC